MLIQIQEVSIHRTTRRPLYEHKKAEKIMLIDLDGVLNQYDGKFDENFIPPIKKGAKEFIVKLAEDYKIKLFTTRNKLLTSMWINSNRLNGYISDVTNVKELCWLIIDDRCINFDGDFRQTIQKITNFKAWYK